MSAGFIISFLFLRLKFHFYSSELNNNFRNIWMGEVGYDLTMECHMTNNSISDKTFNLGMPVSVFVLRIVYILDKLYFLGQN